MSNRERFFRYIALCVVFSFGLYGMTATQPPAGTWHEGYWLAHVIEGSSQISLRYFQEGQWRSQSPSSTAGTGQLYGTGIAQHQDGVRSLLGYSRGGDIYIHSGLGLVFDNSPSYDLKSTAHEGPPTIVHLGGDLWAVALGYSTDIAEMRALYTKRGDIYDGFHPPKILDQDAVGRVAATYHNGKLVLAWQRRKAGEHSFRTLAADIQPTSYGDFDLLNSTEGALPSGPSSYVPEFQADPALAHDGQGFFYIAVLKRSGYTGLTHDGLFIYSSPNGVNWTRVTASLPGNPVFHTGQTNVGIAASPNGDLLVAITTYEGGGMTGRAYMRHNGVWSEIGSQVFSDKPEMLASFSIIRSRYFKQD